MAASTTSAAAQTPHHLVVGAGVFGVSTALHLLARGHAVTLLERSPDGRAAVDAASNDVNKIIRADYQDKHYAALAKRAISAWRTSPLYAPFYHEVGLLLHSGPRPPKDGRAYVQNGIARAHAEVLESDGAGVPFVETPAPGCELPPKARQLKSDADTDACFPPSLRDQLGAALRDMGGSQSAYVNPRAGWAEAGNATHAALREAVRLGARVEGSAVVTSLLREGGIVVGVRAEDGREWRTQQGGKVVICAGAWAHDLLRRLGAPAPHPCTPSAQSVILLQLDDEQRAAFRSAPVVLNFSTGFYIFEPDEHGVLKCVGAAH
ncbi:FAD/NAD(P)-binding domain-containing protein [Tilletiopsis washingtonensis]|uniref:FAD/NAD(P)-binding domain-containing protein n=1 Tax=Tilletiopsis washingtonensis TaxID=58919 RepID=A0A316ZEN6_9BASI|nr:FAD/NAD(P)-binding domain-containing protein [Tilletiopsis washingtonensis]PWO00010.1 FAD/NAD(P)-binding domain-containing protein [Tilletiopsis washingtonensis]